MKGKRIPLVLLVIIVLSLPLLLLGIKQTLDNRSSAAAADNLEAEGGSLSGNATSQSDSTASGGKYIAFGTNQVTQITNIYGPGINIDSKNNNRIGASNRAKLSHRFRATTTSNLNYVMWALRVNDPNKTGYALGDNGSYKISIQTDDGSSNHLPTGNKLAEASGAPGPGDYGGTNVKTVFNSPPLLQKGQIYHVVWENNHSDPINNYFSVNEIFTFDNLTPRQPILNDNDYASLYNTGSGWQIQSNNTADMDLGYADGAHDGVAYLQAFYDSGQEIVARISGPRMAREIFTVTGGNKNISKISVRVAHVSGNSNLNLKILDSSGNQLTSGSIPNNLITVRNWANWTAASNVPTGNWVSFILPNPISLTNGSTYSLILSTNADTTFAAVPIRYLDFSKDFDTPFTGMQSYAFREGKAQESLDNGSSWQDVYSYQSQSNYQFYFTTISNPSSTSSPSPTTQPGTVFNIPTTIDKTGSTDVTSALNNWVASIPNGTSSNPSILKFPSGGIYLINQGIQFKDRSNLIFDGYGTKLILNPSAGFTQLQSMFLLGKGYGSFFGGTNSNIIIRGFDFEASNPTPGRFDASREHQHGVEINNSNGVEVYDITVKGVGGDGVKIGDSTNINLHDMNIIDAGRQGVSVISGSQIMIEKNHFEDVGYYIFDVEPNNDTESATNITFRNNTMGSWGPDIGVGGGFVAAGSGVAYLQVNNITVSGNSFIKGAVVKEGQLVSTLRSYFNQNQHRRLNNIVFTNNKSTQSTPGPVLEFKSIDGLTVTGNTQPLSSGVLGSYTNNTNAITNPNP